MLLRRLRRGEGFEPKVQNTDLNDTKRDLAIYGIYEPSVSSAYTFLIKA